MEEREDEDMELEYIHECRLGPEAPKCTSNASISVIFGPSFIKNYSTHSQYTDDVQKARKTAKLSNVYKNTNTLLNNSQTFYEFTLIQLLHLWIERLTHIIEFGTLRKSASGQERDVPVSRA